jgi:hypothetical protein
VPPLWLTTLTDTRCLGPVHKVLSSSAPPSGEVHHPPNSCKNRLSVLPELHPQLPPYCLRSQTGDTSTFNRSHCAGFSTTTKSLILGPFRGINGNYVMWTLPPLRGHIKRNYGLCVGLDSHVRHGDNPSISARGISGSSSRIPGSLLRVARHPGSRSRVRIWF